MESSSLATDLVDGDSKEPPMAENGPLEDTQQSIDQQEPGSLSGVPVASLEGGAEKSQSPGLKESSEAKAARQQLKEEQRLQKELKKEQDKRERELKRERERQEKELKRLEDKERKENEKKERELKRIEEKRSRELKREQEKRERELRKEEEKRKKLEEKAKREEDKKQKEETQDKSQTKIASFFKKSNSSKNVVATKTDFEKWFLPFYVKDGIIMGHSFKLSPDSLKISISQIDAQLKLDGFPDQSKEWLQSQRPAKTEVLANTAVELVQLMTSKNKSNQELDQRLRQVPQRFIKFYENVRPPYIGTYSKCLELPRDNPFATEGTGFDYGYDSDWDWVNEEEEDGGDVEDLEDGEDEDEDEDLDDGTEDEFDGFLDREGSQGPQDGKKFLGPLIPIVKLRSKIGQLDAEDQQYFQMVSVQYLIPEEPFPIILNHTPRTAAVTKKRLLDFDAKIDESTGTMDSQSLDDTTKTSNQTSQTSLKKPKTIISDPQTLLKILAEVHESTFSLGTITEILQKKLPNHTKVAIRDTIKEHTTRPSVKAGSSRKWLVKNPEFWDSLKKK
ncbi:LAME_0C05094g1_1 [Lachancea meyersii CBS 8951]|uniref:LAME_0C05094g1_1 n=1 Tax=Lachancea meyersii CBS 8951 TaxID=1266667 RepID=A0A1G4J238_9SACH|nr:LAME_0C05094g1_1 [Lachancea meyersii CBS 8951]